MESSHHPALGASQHARRSFRSDLWQLTQAATALFVLTAFTVEVARSAYALITGGVAGAQAVASHGAIGVRVLIPLPDPIAELAIACILLGVLTYIGLAYVCESQWVQEPVEVEDCWREKDWWNPFHWVWVVVCVVKEVLKWVLKQICGWKEIWAIILTVVCIVVVLVIVLA